MKKPLTPKVMDREPTDALDSSYLEMQEYDFLDNKSQESSCDLWEEVKDA